MPRRHRRRARVRAHAPAFDVHTLSARTLVDWHARPRPDMHGPPTAPYHFRFEREQYLYVLESTRDDHTGEWPVLVARPVRAGRARRCVGGGGSRTVRRVRRGGVLGREGTSEANCREEHTP
ncbi:hypothetical protein GCM10010329_41750 [Streptomyces spiroverticillatus]|uniref:Uncharacterized protein n=1 Tax=Streptomyces finlayi TaxID=67296 RepID=A0A918WZB1_9ACTN|nr:hypothetical protein GCM10010329_41750 [Streptomyces spiroverticillatus]GHC97307.1 hypothetical protein GCM10010334_38490 [Streptomyces finlayi]